MARTALSCAEARRVALAAQGFARARPGRVDARHLRRTIGELGLLQLDYVNVLVPAHYQVPFARLGPYERRRLDDAFYRSGCFTEQWAHQASVIPLSTWPLLRHRMHDAARPRLAALAKRHRRFFEEVLEEVRARGPLPASELEGPPRRRREPGAWRSWTLAKSALEWHFVRGVLAVAERRDMVRHYDLAERVVPAEHRDPVPEAQAQRQLLETAARAHGVATAGDLADYWKMSRPGVRARLAELVEAGALLPVEVEGWGEDAFLHPSARLPRHVDARALLSPFDPLVWTRPRVSRVFAFDYRIEIFVPAARRRFGYYVLPFLLGDRLVARVDLKAERPARRLRVASAWAERDVDEGEVATALARELRLQAGWLGLEAVRVDRRGDLAGKLAQALAR